MFKTPFHGVDVFVSVCVLLLCLLYVAVCSTSLVSAVRSVSKTLARELSRTLPVIRSVVCVSPVPRVGFHVQHGDTTRGSGRHTDHRTNAVYATRHTLLVMTIVRVHVNAGGCHATAAVTPVE